ncbi:MAG: hypothetical protein AAFN70_14085, partial [Planctomycetota bacterium]
SAAAHGIAAQIPLRQSDDASLSDAARRSLQQSGQRHLLSSRDRFLDLKQRLSALEEARDLSPAESTMLRNSFLGIADALFQLGRYDESAAAYRAMSLRYMDRPEALEAMLGQEQCLRKMNRAREADLLRRQAAVVLQRIDGSLNDAFAQRTRHSREGWQALLAN